MNIYALRDRMLNYYLTPFCGPNDNDVLAAVSHRVSQVDTTDAIATAPHHFEIWKLGTVNVDGTITPERDLLADCETLIRRAPKNERRAPNGAHPGETPTTPQGDTGNLSTRPVSPVPS